MKVFAMDYQGLFLTAQFLNDRKKASRKEITAFLAKSINASQSKADALINALAASAAILNLPPPQRLVVKTGRGIYEISQAGEKILKGKDARQNFMRKLDEVYGAAQKSQTLKSSSPKIREYAKDVALALLCELKDKLVGELKSKPMQAFKSLALKIVKKHKILGKIYAFRHIFIAVLAAKLAFEAFQILRRRREKRLQTATLG